MEFFAGVLGFCPESVSVGRHADHVKSECKDSTDMQYVSFIFITSGKQVVPAMM